MRRWAPLILLGAAGCTNAPLAGFLDLVHPSHVYRNTADRERAGGEPLAPPPPGGQLLPPAAPPPPPAGFAPPPAGSGFTPSDDRGLGPLSIPNT